MSASRTASRTSTFTEARARQVMKSVFDELVAVALRGLISMDRAQKWDDDLTYLLSRQVIAHFELQFTLPGGRRVGFRYEVSDDGSLIESSRSGGLRLHMLPDGTTASLFVTYRDVDEETVAEMRRRGWGSGGSSLSGASTRERAHSDQGYGVIRMRVGDW